MTQALSLNRRKSLAYLAGLGVVDGLLVGCGGASGSETASPASGSVVSPGWDLLVDAVVDVLQTAHVQPWGGLSQAVFLNEANTLKLRINTLPAQLAAVEAMALVASIGDGHTNLSTWALHRWLGLGFVNFSDGLFVASASAQWQGLVGAQVLQFGGMTAAQTVSAAAKLWPTENASAELAWGQWLASSINALRFMGATGNLTDVRLTIRRAGAVANEVVVVAADQSSRIGPYFNPPAAELRHREFQQPDTPYWYEWIASSRTLYFRYRDCRDAPRFAEFSSQMFNQIDSLPVRALVVDLRGNRGGDSGVWRPFLQGLSARAATSMAAQAGALRFITDRFTFSAAVDASLDLLQVGALHIGEAPGQSPNFLGNVVTRSLTSLNLGMQYPTRISNRVSGNPASIVPAVTVLRSSTDYLEGRDPALVRAMA